MNRQDYHSSFLANVTAKEAFDGINRVSEWWTNNVQGSSVNLNDTFTVTFGETSSLMKIIESVPYKKIVWDVVDCYLHFLKDKEEWKGTKIIFEISSKDGLTQVDMTHQGLVPELECYNNCFDGWNFYITKSLCSLLNHHKGAPDTNVHERKNKEDIRRLAPRAVADIENGSIIAAAELVLPPDRVYSALTHAREIENWWGSADTYRMTNWKADLRVGGKYSVVVRSADGNDFPASGTFLELDAPNKIVHTRKYDWDHATLGRKETTISYHLEPIDIGTRITVKHEGFSGCNEAAYEHAAGWERVLGWLDHYIFYNFYFPKKMAE